MRLIPIVLCGGAGSRLWPVSREAHPKPFIKLADGKSLLQKTILRCENLSNISEIVIVTNRELFFKVKDEIAELGTTINITYLLEPSARNTAAAIALASLYVNERYGRDVNMLVMPADHIINNQAEFVQVIDKACTLSLDKKIITFGITPESPETGYGYIKAQGKKVIKFVEKPTIEKAQEYIAAGDYLWNSGMFCFIAEVLINELEVNAPQILTNAKKCIDQSEVLHANNYVQIEFDIDSFMLIPEDSIDYALIEKTKNVAVVICENLGWSDIGSWNAISALGNNDELGNNIEGKALVQDVSNCYIRSPDRLVGAIGLDNLLIVDTPDALLVADKSKDQDVKRLYTSLKEKGLDSYKFHRTVYRPWGTYSVLEEGHHFKIKKISVKSGASLSLQMHYHRSEHWIVVSGTAKVINGNQELQINKNESTYIPAGNKHRLENPGVNDLVIIEVQSGEYLGEDDIVRFDDNYGRSIVESD